jgi:hypothetical protein
MKNENICTVKYRKRKFVHWEISRIEEYSHEHKPEPTHCKDKIPKFRGLSPNIHIHVSVSDLYSQDRSAYSAGGNMWTDPGTK